MLRFTNAERTAATFDGTFFPVPEPGDFASVPDATVRKKVLRYLADGGVAVPYTAPDEPPRQVLKSTITARLIAAGKIGKALAALQADPAAFARWIAPDKPAVNSDDAATIALLKAVGADQDAILAGSA